MIKENQNLIIIISILTITLFSIVFYGYGFKKGSEDGFKRALLEIERVGGIENIQNRGVFSELGIVMNISSSKIVVAIDEKERSFSITDKTSFYRDYNITPTEFDELEARFREIEEEYEEQERLGGANEEVKRNYFIAKEGFYDILKGAQSEGVEISPKEIKIGSVVTIEDNNGVAIKIKDFK